MKAVLQRVKFAKVAVGQAPHPQQIVGEIAHGVLVYLGLGHDDTLAMGQKMIDKILTYRIFENALGKMDKNVQQVNGGLLLVSQFTLLANTQSGRRPDFKPAMAPDTAKALFAQIVAYAKTQYAAVQTGEFGADMQVSSCNDGPINFIFEL
ncbi:D-tyrosyl-tRNA(Tyr) deacylase [bacterium M00.F.Ca.ET.230.01.1.1]|nr:D-tyrosyl-tRNA(Tyr) deacylase [bacterium M00.F.Ca.ET.230.01.1.1]